MVLHKDFHVIIIFSKVSQFCSGELQSRLSDHSQQFSDDNQVNHAALFQHFTSKCPFFRGKDLVKTREQGQAGASQRPWLNKSLVAVKEQGMLFHFNPSDIEVLMIICTYLC